MAEEPRWLLLMHQIPPKPGYLRVKIWRQLQRIGAVAIKNSVYVLPRGEQAQEDFQWIARAVVEGGGDASLCEARFAGSPTDDQIEALFLAARDADYAQLGEEATQLEADLPVPVDEEARARAETEVARLRRRLGEIEAIDFFSAPGHDPVEKLVTALEARLRRGPAAGEPAALRHADHRGRTWVTRKGIHVDRMACAWLIRRFIDPEAQLSFVDARSYRPAPGELRFDMFEAEFTHEGDRCSFEVVVARFLLDDPALVPLAEIVHDIDLKERRFDRPETAGVASLVAGIAMLHRDDLARLAGATVVFDALYEQFRRKKRETP